jgi:hypothetical protein
MKKLLYLTLFLGLAYTVQGQHTNPKKLSLEVSYFGETAIHPGIKTGISYTFWEKEKSRKRWSKGRQGRLGPKVKTHQFVTGANLAFYNHANNHSGLLPNAMIGWQKINQRRGTMIGAQLGIGYLLRIYNIPTYELGENGNPEQVTAAGRGQFAPSLSILWGKDLSVKGDKPISWYIKPALFLLAPYNHTVLPNFALELGISYHLSRENK